MGSFSIGSYPDLALHYLPPVLSEYRSRYPDARIKVVARPYQVLMEALEAGEVVMALVHATDDEGKDISFVHLFDAPFNLLAPIGHPILDDPAISLETIAEWPLILLSLDSYARRYFENAVNEKGLRLQVGLEMDHSELVRRYVETGMGVAHDRHAVRFRTKKQHQAWGARPEPYLSTGQIGLAVKASHERSAALWEFIEDLKAAAIGARMRSDREGRAAS